MESGQARSGCSHTHHACQLSQTGRCLYLLSSRNKKTSLQPHPPSSPANQRLQQLSQWEASMLPPPPQLFQWTLPLSQPLPTPPFPYKSKSPFLVLWVCLWSVVVCIFLIEVPPLFLSKLPFVGEITGCHIITVDRGLSLALSCTGSDCLDAVTLVDVIRFQELGFI